MRIKLMVALTAALLLSVPCFAQITVFAQPTDGDYIASTGGVGAGFGGDGSGGTITSGGHFSFSSGLDEFSVPGSWATWNCPPATESCTPNVLYTAGATTLTLTPTDTVNTAGFELEPDLFQVETVTAQFFFADGTSHTITLMPNGSAGALLYALQNASPGGAITSILITDTAGDDFAIAQLRAGSCVCCYMPSGPNCGPPVPEPGTLVLLGTGALTLPVPFAANFSNYVGALRRRRRTRLDLN